MPLTVLVQALRRTGWALLAVLTFWAVAAKAFHAYLIYPWLDMPTHFAGGMAIAYVVTAVIEQSGQHIGVTPRLVKYFTALGLTAVAAIGWEFLEFLSDGGDRPLRSMSRMRTLH